MSEETKKLTNQEKIVSWQELSSSSDEEEGKAPQSPKVIRTGNEYRNKRFICSMLCLLILFIGYLLIMQWVFHENDGTYEPISDSIMASANRFHHNSRIHRCDDRGFDCCYIYTEQHNYQFNPRYILGKDEQGSNCPSLKDIVNRYNNYLELYEMNANCTEVQCCHVDNTKENKIRNHRDEVETLVIESELNVINHVTTCPSIHHLMYMESHNYPDPNRDLYIIGGIFVILICWVLCSQ